MNELSTNLLEVVEETKQLMGGVRRNLVKVMQNLALLRENNQVWGEYDTFAKYADAELNVPHSMCTKLLKAHDGWVLQAGVQPDRLQGIDYEKLYGYLPLLEGKDPELALAEVSTWSRADIRDQKQETKPHEPNFKEVCVVAGCWLPRDRHGS